MSAENGQHDQQTEHEFQALYLPSPVAAVAGPWENIVDRDMDASYFFVSSVAAPAGCSYMLFSRRADLRKIC